jgi:hypothetical protein
VVPEFSGLDFARNASPKRRAQPVLAVSSDGGSVPPCQEELKWKGHHVHRRSEGHEEPVAAVDWLSPIDLFTRDHVAASADRNDVIARRIADSRLEDMECELT